MVLTWMIPNFYYFPSTQVSTITHHTHNLFIQHLISFTLLQPNFVVSNHYQIALHVIIISQPHSQPFKPCLNLLRLSNRPNLLLGLVEWGLEDSLWNHTIMAKGRRACWTTFYIFLDGQKLFAFKCLKFCT